MPGSVQASTMRRPSTELTLPHRRSAPTRPGFLLERPNRFLGVVRLPSGEVVEAHIADRGRLTEILFPGAEVLIQPASGEKRRTAFTLICARAPMEDIWVCIDPAGANRLVRAALETGLLDELPTWVGIRQEVRHGASRFDFALDLACGGELLLEVKSAAVAEQGVALFPDAPSERAVRHCRELAALAEEGRRTAIVLVAQRGDARAIAPHPVDPAFAAALRDAKEAGVVILGLGFAVSETGFRCTGRIPVQLGRGDEARGLEG